MSGTDLSHLSPIAALHADCKRYPKGLPALAKVVGRSAGVLYNKFSEADERYAITDNEADALAREVERVTGLHGYIDAKCAEHGGIFVPLPAGKAGEDDLLASQLEMMRRFGELAQEFTEARADGLITSDEFSALKVAGDRAVRAVLAFVSEIKTLVAEPEKAGELVDIVSGGRRG